MDCVGYRQCNTDEYFSSPFFHQNETKRLYMITLKLFYSILLTLTPLFN